MPLCSPWLDVDDVTLCAAADPKLPKALEVATWLLYFATGQKFPGVCADSIRPCQQATGAVQMLDYSTGGSRPLPVMGGCGCGGGISCGCTVHSAVKLPGTPVIDATATIDGVPVDAEVVLRASGEYLVRADGGWWPCCQDILAADDAPGAFTIAYRYGLMPPPPVLIAAEFLACQFVVSWCTEGDGSCGDCKLPQRLTQLTYEGATMQTLDPFDFLENGTFGIAEVDYAVRAVNPSGMSRPAAVRTARDFLEQPIRRL